MKATRLLAAAFILTAASLHAQVQPARVPVRVGQSLAPASTTPTLSTNYRLTLTAKSGDKSLGAVSQLTCSTGLEVSGFLDKPQEDSMPATTLSLHGKMAEQEDGTLLVTYHFGLSVPVVSSTTTSAPAKSKDAAGDKAEPAPQTTVFSFRDHSSSGALRVRPGRSYELMTMAGVAYTLTISAEPQK
ncbi:hypothetical protein [Prosthecobacter vanneervenii]|uniref:Uncharacterized protein n=1 Tax=Prosthecobacter vanneervenii TaxID=48466 RepID=A0A7W8DKJ9_9BACT|nr:hypothetical protein [Prosthecobacter vanneervenii]MBB5033334.1 hypothetical protein [Prosthecobacter vanneervenii]